MDRRLAVYSGSHLVVDFACFFVLKGCFSASTSGLTLGVGFLLYNLIAFALQAPLGYAVDKIRVRPFVLTVTGSLLVAVGVLLQVAPWAAVVVCASGNALFHLGGGIDSLANARGRYTRPGVFISFGALGVVAGTWTGSQQWLPAWTVVVIVLCCVGLQLLVRESVPHQTSAVFRLAPAPVTRGDIAILLLMLVIVVRALGGLLVDTPWKTGVTLTTVAAACVFAGKFVGGMLADRFGARNIVVVSLAVSAPLLTIWSGNVVAACMGLFCFNIMTSVTLVAIASRLPDNPGFAFGLTTLALFIGATIPMVMLISPSVASWMLWALIAVALVCGALTTSNHKEVVA